MAISLEQQLAIEESVRDFLKTPLSVIQYARAHGLKDSTFRDRVKTHLKNYPYEATEKVRRYLMTDKERELPNPVESYRELTAEELEAVELYPELSTGKKAPSKPKAPKEPKEVVKPSVAISPSEWLVGYEPSTKYYYLYVMDTEEIRELESMGVTVETPKYTQEELKRMYEDQLEKDERAQESRDLLKEIDNLLKDTKKGSFTFKASKEVLDDLRALATVTKTTQAEIIEKALVEYYKTHQDEYIRAKQLRQLFNL